jgi:hypothetical protein
LATQATFPLNSFLTPPGGVDDRPCCLLN